MTFEEDFSELKGHIFCADGDSYQAVPLFAVDKHCLSNKRTVKSINESFDVNINTCEHTKEIVEAILLNVKKELLKKLGLEK